MPDNDVEMTFPIEILMTAQLKHPLLKLKSSDSSQWNLICKKKA